MGRALFFVKHSPQARIAAILSAVAAVSAATPAMADYSSVVLYPLTPPSTITGGISLASLAPYPEVANAGQVVATDYDSSGTSHALLWAEGSAAVDLTPATGYDDTFAFSTSGSQQVGGGYVSSTTISHALLWSGSAASAVDLNPAAYSNSLAYAVAGNKQVGFAGDSDGNSHAMLWTGTAASAVDLNPAGYDQSVASGTDGVSQVGIAIGTSTGENEQAILWTGTANSAVNLNPAGYSSSYADSVNGSQQVGVAWGGTDEHNHAFLWSGSATTAIDLAPTNLTDITDSEAFSTNGTQQVGYGFDTNSNSHALLWLGSGASAVDLQTLLPAAGTWTDSTAYSIDSAGHVYGIANGTYDGTTGIFGIEWLTSAPILGDANLDGAVNSADFDALMNGFANGLSGWSNGDFNEDGVVNSDDWALFQLGLAAYQAGAGITVPEPSAVMMALGAGGFLFRRRR